MICHFVKKVFIQTGAGEDEFKGVGSIFFKDRLLVLIVLGMVHSKGRGQLGSAVSGRALVPFSELGLDFIWSSVNF